jgi:hypothetical protein
MAKEPPGDIQMSEVRLRPTVFVMLEIMVLKSVLQGESSYNNNKK